MIIQLSALLATDGVHLKCSGFSGRLGYVADFRCRRCMDGDSAQVVLSSEVEIEPGVKVECVSTFSIWVKLGDTLGSGGGKVDAARAGVRCAWAEFKELSHIFTVRSAIISYQRKDLSCLCPECLDIWN